MECFYFLKYGLHLLLNMIRIPKEFYIYTLFIISPPSLSRRDLSSKSDDGAKGLRWLDNVLSSFAGVPFPRTFYHAGTLTCNHTAPIVQTPSGSSQEAPLYGSFPCFREPRSILHFTVLVANSSASKSIYLYHFQHKFKRFLMQCEVWEVV